MPHDKPTPRAKRADAGKGARPPWTDELVLKDRALDASAEGITIADARRPDQPLIYVNKGFERLTGYAAEDVLGRNCRFLQGGETDPATVATISEAVEKGAECVVELLNYRKNGEPFWNRLSINPIKDDAGTVTHFIGVQSDITARKNAEEALRETNARLERANQRISRNLELAARIQRGFLPEKAPRIDGVEIAWELRSCDELAGDTLNAVPLDGRSVEFYTIDVSGHGVPAALLSVTLNHLLSPAGGRLILAGQSPEVAGDSGIPSPVEIARTLSKQFPYDDERNQYFTLAYGVYDMEERVFRFVCAGHPPPIHVSRSGETRVEWRAGLPIGVAPEFEYEQNTLRLAPGDRVYLYSDGLTDVFNEIQEPFGVERLEQLIKETRHEPLKASVRSAIDAVESWGRSARFDDDVSILAFEAR